MRRGELRAGDRVEAPERSGQRALYPGTVIQAHVSQGQTASVTLLFDDETLRRRAPVAEVKRERAGTACDVCNKAHSDKGNEIVICDKCGVHVHQCCYNVVLPTSKGDAWYCLPCSRGSDSRRTHCMLCPTHGRPGAFSLLADADDAYVHTACALTW